jgi:DNA-binding response OmpR family regulator
MSDLANKRILLVEDEVIIAMMLEDMITELGGIVVGPASTLDSGMALATNELVDGAILDVNLGAGNSYAIADILAARNIPFLMATGYGHTTDNVHSAPLLQKPYLINDIEQALRSILLN